jgi:hypothetical protein
VKTVKNLFTLLVAAVLMIGVVSVYAEDASPVPAQGTVMTRKNVKKSVKHHRHHGKRKARETKTETSASAEQ